MAIGDDAEASPRPESTGQARRGYNLARIHKTLRITPAMAAGLSDHVWSLEEIALLVQ
jgi:hypothetical protein